jgi:hypothetical protein
MKSGLRAAPALVIDRSAGQADFTMTLKAIRRFCATSIALHDSVSARRPWATCAAKVPEVRRKKLPQPCWAGRRRMMEASKFVDYYEILEISPNANSGTIDRMFRYLAQRYHPDNPDTGDRARFDRIVEAHDTLKDPVNRAQYDIQHKSHSSFRWKLAEEASDSKGIARDGDIQRKLLSILYVKRRQDIREPGVGSFELERLLGCPAEHLDFHLWYLKEKRWIEKTETGTLAITVEGVDHANSLHPHKPTSKLLTDQNGKR